MLETIQNICKEFYMIYSFSPFGYDGSIISVEVDLRHGIPSTDIVGLADVACSFGK